MNARLDRVDTPLPPGSTVGILGSGQLARMLATAAAKLGLRCHVYADAAGPAFDVAAETTVAGYGDREALKRFAGSVAVATYEFENIPVATVATLAARLPVRPLASALAVTQDRIAEKLMARKLGIATTDFADITDPADIRAAVETGTVALPAILKTRRFGYDGKGQTRIAAFDGIDRAWAAIGGAPAILEGVVRFEREVSVVAVRGLDGQFAAYDPIENVHKDHILHTSTVPAALRPETTRSALDIAERIARALDYVGTFAVELFVAKEPGGGERLLLNEIAPRVHNSGHWTADACAVSQFENHIRAITGWPLGSTERHSNAVMTNLIGGDIERWRDLAAEPGASLTIYGKRDARPGRKMGHVTRLSPRL